MIPPRTNRPRTRPANASAVARTRQSALVHPVLREIARTRPAYTNATIDGRPIRVYLERPRWGLSIPWIKIAALTTAIAAPAIGTVYLLTVALMWTVHHWYLVVAALVLLVLTPLGLGRAGVCPGFHCPGCRH